MPEHGQVPANPVDGQVFTCAHCGEMCTFVDLDDGLPGEWVITS